MGVTNTSFSTSTILVTSTGTSFMTTTVSITRFSTTTFFSTLMISGAAFVSASFTSPASLLGQVVKLQLRRDKLRTTRAANRM